MCVCVCKRKFVCVCVCVGSNATRPVHCLCGWGLHIYGGTIDCANSKQRLLIKGQGRGLCVPGMCAWNEMKRFSGERRAFIEHTYTAIARVLIIHRYMGTRRGSFRLAAIDMGRGLFEVGSVDR